MVFGRTKSWPYRGEIDIIEAVNEDSTNQMTLHTAQNCTMQRTPWANNMTGVSTGDNCDVWQTGNGGCGVRGGKYGSTFNGAGGGAYVTEWTESGVKIWYFAMQDMPADILSSHPNPDAWTATPQSTFPFGSSCDANHFGPQSVIFDITFCGDWAGNVYQGSQCPGTCVDFVANNPAAFLDTYWSIRALRVYSKQ